MQRGERAFDRHVIRSSALAFDPEISMKTTLASLAAATIVGRDLARRVLGRPEEDLTFPVSPLRPLRSHRLARLAVAATISAYRWLDRREAPAPLRRTSLHGRTINR